RALDHLVLVIKHRNMRARFEDFLLADLGVVRQAGPDGGLDPIAIGERSWHLDYAAASDNTGTRPRGALVEAENFFLLLLADRGSKRRGRVHRITGLQRSRALANCCDEALEDAALHEDSLGRQADLSAIVEHRARGSGNGRLEIAVIEDDGRVLAAKLQRHRARTGSGSAHDGFAGARLSGKGDRVDPR